VATLTRQPHGVRRALCRAGCLLVTSDRHLHQLRAARLSRPIAGPGRPLDGAAAVPRGREAYRSRDRKLTDHDDDDDDDDRDDDDDASSSCLLWIDHLYNAQEWWLILIG